MPYTNTNQLPEYVNKYPDKVQRQFMHVFNTVFEKTKNEDRALKAAKSVLGKNLDNDVVHDEHTRLLYQIDKYLGVMRK